MKLNDYSLPLFLEGTVDLARYRRWLSRKAQAHHHRDRGRGNTTASLAAYKKAIHAAVVSSKGRDDYTGEALDWSLIGTYENVKSKATGRVGKAKLALLPTVDHVGDGLGDPDFHICGWAVNDAKSDLSLDLFLDLCAKVLKHSGRGTPANSAAQADG
jgi:hypothetical protein